MPGEALATYPKQPGERRDYDIDFTKYLALRDDSIISHVSDCDEGITIDYSEVVENRFVKLWMTGGTSGARYNVNVRITTLGGREIEGDIIIEVEEIGRTAP